MTFDRTAEMPQWQRAGYYSRMLNLDGEPPLALSVEDRDDWRAGYRKACEFLKFDGGAA